MNYREQLPQRIPEALQDDNDLRNYLEVCGELFDIYYDAIEQFDDYKDSYDVPEQRIMDLAREFAMEFPRNLGEDLQRTILRDLEQIFQKNGTTDVINWIFRLIGWDVSLEYAWVLNPEYYDPEIKNQFDLSNYGREDLKSDPVITDFYSRDYRDFLLGEEYIFENGTYFRGRRFFDKKDTFLKTEIVGQHYTYEKTRTPDKVMATSYLFIRVSEESYNIFIQPYFDEETGQTYSYTDVEFFEVVENIFNFFMFDANRPTHLRVVIIVTPQFLEDNAVIINRYTDNYTSKPLAINDDLVVEDVDNSFLVHTALVGNTFISGTPCSPFHKDMVINPVAFRNLAGVLSNQSVFYYVDHTQGFYKILRNEQDYIGPRSGAIQWRFITPHEESYQFRRVYTYTDSLVDVTSNTGVGNVYENDRDSLRINFDLTTPSFGIYDESATRAITIRNETSINSYNFHESTKPANAYDIGGTETDADTGEDFFSPNRHIAMDFREDGELLANTDTKSFWYVYDIATKYKENNLSSVWYDFVTMPEKGDLNNISIANTFAPVFNQPVPYDFEMEVTYEAQPTWENRNR